MPTLSAVRVRDAKPREKPYKLFDERGLYLLVTPSADQHRGRLWRFRYRQNGTEKLLALGTYPDVSLKRAREKRDEARRLLADGVDPNVQRKTERAASTETFEAIGREWLTHRAKTTAAITQQKATWLLEQIFAEIGSRPIREVAAPELLAALRKIEARGHQESAHRAKQKCGQVFRYAIATGRAERDISSDLRGALVHALKRFAVFDEQSVHIHLDEPNKVSFVPAHIAIFDKVAAALAKVERRVRNPPCQCRERHLPGG